MRFTLVPIGAAMLVAALAPSAEAQVQVQFGSSAPSYEFGAHIRLLDLIGDATHTRGGRVAKRYADWLVGEVSYDKTSWTYEDRATRLLIAGMRLQAPFTDRGRRPFVTVGVARADGLSFKWSPVLSPGIQHELPSGVAMLRIEMQFFARGRAQSATYDRARLLIGVGIGIP